LNFRLKVTLWFSISVILIVSALLLVAHAHLDEELREDRWDRSHPKFPEWVIHGSFTDAEVHDILHELLWVWLVVGLPLVAASVGIGYWIAVQSVLPIRRINRELSVLSVESLQRGITASDRDPEIHALISHLNDLLCRLHDSYSEMAEFAGRVAHELRTPLTHLRMRLEEAAPSLPPDFSEEMQDGIRQLSRLVERSLLAAKAEGGRLSPTLADVDLSLLLEDLREAYDLAAAEKRIELRWRVHRGIQCRTDPELLRQILHNLFGNAVRHGFRLARVRLYFSRKNRSLVLCISNFTAPTEVNSEGMGIGLRLVRSLCSVLPGTRFASRKAVRVFSVRLTLPATQDSCSKK
jgi:signal transduction histidine kinase